jgi:hypothetical protein
MTFVNDAASAKAKLEEIMHSKLAHTAEVVTRVMGEVPQDAIVKADALAFPVRDDGALTLALPNGVAYTLHQNARRQAAGRVGMPTQYLDVLADGEPWQRALAGKILTESYQHQTGRNLIRAYNGQARAVLSDHYRRLDSRPILDAFIGQVRDAGGLPYDAHASDVRVSIKALVPVVHEVEVAGGMRAGAHMNGDARGREFLVFGIEGSNSDYGVGAFSIRAFFLRLVCLNGATVEDAMRQVHLGGRLTDDIQFSEATYRKDTAATVSALRDVVRNQLGPARIDLLVDGIKRAGEQPVEWSKLKTRLATALTKEELRKATETFEGQDVINVPAGNTAWRASNAISWLANGQDVTADRKLALEKIAGGLLLGKVVAEAA